MRGGEGAKVVPSNRAGDALCGRALQPGHRRPVVALQGEADRLGFGRAVGEVVPTNCQEKALHHGQVERGLDERLRAARVLSQAAGGAADRQRAIEARWPAVGDEPELAPDLHDRQHRRHRHLVVEKDRGHPGRQRRARRHRELDRAEARRPKRVAGLEAHVDLQGPGRRQRRGGGLHPDAKERIDEQREGQLFLRPPAAVAVT